MGAAAADASPPAPSRLIDAPPDAPATLVLAHGAGGSMDSPFLTAIATGLASQGWRIWRFEFPYMARQRLTGRKGAPDALPKLLHSFRDEVALAATAGPVFVGGKSLGGRVASLVVDDLAPADVRGCLCLGYPFHPPGKPNQLRTDHLAVLHTPTLILQGERDPFGRRDEVEHYALSPKLQVEWIPSGDHGFQPRRDSGLTTADTWALAVTRADHFCRECLGLEPGQPSRI